MKRLLFLILGSAVVIGMGAGPALADNGPHIRPIQTGTTNPYSDTSVTYANQDASVDKCAGCHRVHTAQASKLLVQAQPNLCFSCHGSAAAGAANDVVDGLGYANSSRPDTPGPGALRGGGFDFALIDSGNAKRSVYWSTTYLPAKWSAKNQTIPVLAVGEPTTSNHNVSGTSTTLLWGNGAISAGTNYGANVTLECGSCHDPHGNGNYRILKPIPNESGATTGVTVPDASPKVYTTTDYWLSQDVNVPTQDVIVGTTTYKPDGFIANISAWCSTCHTRYLAAGDKETPSGDAVYKYRHKTDQNTRAGGRNCITCHVSHGSNASAGGTYSSQVKMPDGSAALGDSRLLRVDNRGICNMCHVK